jgi:predicted membrane protein
MSNHERPRITGKLIGGVILIALGILFLLDNLGWFEAGDLFSYWPLILVAVGLSRLLGRDRFGGAVLVIVGVLLQLHWLDIISLRFEILWPLALVLIGAYVIWRAVFSRPGAPARAAVSGAYLNEWTLLGGGDTVVNSKEFRGGDVSVMLGGYDIDLRNASIAGDAAVLEVFVLMGGIDMRVPDDWTVMVSGTPVLGAFSNDTRAPREGDRPGKRLIVKGLAIMGGVEIKN